MSGTRKVDPAGHPTAPPASHVTSADVDASMDRYDYSADTRQIVASENLLPLKAIAETRRLRKAADDKSRRVSELEARITERETAIKELEAQMSSHGFYEDRDTADRLVARHHTLNVGGGRPHESVGSPPGNSPKRLAQRHFCYLFVISDQDCNHLEASASLPITVQARFWWVNRVLGWA